MSESNLSKRKINPVGVARLLNNTCFHFRRPCLFNPEGMALQRPVRKGWYLLTERIRSAESTALSLAGVDRVYFVYELGAGFIMQ